MNIQTFLLSYGQLISITAIPIVVWFLGIKFQNRMLKRKAKEDLFLKLMAHRKQNPLSRQWCDSLNQIDVVFQADSGVRAAWRAYYDSLNAKSQHFENQNSFQLDLLSEIANSLGYRNIKQTELDRFYSPKYFGDQTKLKDELINEKIRVLRTSHIFNYKVSSDDKEVEDIEYSEEQATDQEQNEAKNSER